MSSATYELIALAARYWFAGVALLIVIRAWRCTVQDNRRAKVLRDWTPETGCVGELIALTGGKKFKKGERFPVLRESVLGSGRNADIRIPHPSIQKAHIHMELREGGMLARGMQNAEFSLPGQGNVRKMLLRDGMEFTVGTVRWCCTTPRPRTTRIPLRSLSPGRARFRRPSEGRPLSLSPSRNPRIRSSRISGRTIPRTSPKYKPQTHKCSLIKPLVACTPLNVAPFHPQDRLRRAEAKRKEAPWLSKNIGPTRRCFAKWCCAPIPRF